MAKFVTDYLEAGERGGETGEALFPWVARVGLQPRKRAAHDVGELPADQHSCLRWLGTRELWSEGP
jgi:hypothetical protein